MKRFFRFTLRDWFLLLVLFGACLALRGPLMASCYGLYQMAAAACGYPGQAYNEPDWWQGWKRGNEFVGHGQH
jgi:hypothetical protein